MAATRTYALRFIAGRYKGGEFPLRPNREIVVGRGSEFDMVLDEDMVSRRHAKLATYHGQMVLQDLKSTNGTFVNGERIAVARLKVGDKVVIGTSIMELVEAGRPVVPTPQPEETVDDTPAEPPATERRSAPHGLPQPPPPPAPLDLPQPPPPPGTPPPSPAATARPTIDRSHEGMSGHYPDDVSVPELVELFVGSRRTGVLHLSESDGRAGAMWLREGHVCRAEIRDPDGQPSPVDPLKAFFRLLTWQRGEFRLETVARAPQFEDEITGDTRELLIEAMRQLDELQRYAAHLPAPEAGLALQVPLEARLSALSPEALDTLQVVINCGRMDLVLDYSVASDLETAQDLLYLMQNGYVVVTG